MHFLHHDQVLALKYLVSQTMHMLGQLDAEFLSWRDSIFRQILVDSGTEASSLKVIWFPLATCYHACNKLVCCQNHGPQLGLHLCLDNWMAKFILWWWWWCRRLRFSSSSFFTHILITYSWS